MKYQVLFILVMLCVSVTIADIPANQTPETQGFDSETMIINDGLTIESDSLVWQGSTCTLDNQLSGAKTVTPWNLTGGMWQTIYIGDTTGYEISFIPNSIYPVAQGDVFFWDVDPENNLPGEVQFITSYNENTIADSGKTTYTKSLNIDTQNKPANQDNFEADKIITFEGSATGRIVSDESLLLDTAGNYSRTGNLFACPFVAATYSVTPQFCNIEEMGSSVNMEQMTMTTSARDRFVAATADVPVAMDYNFEVTGVGDAPALGDVMAFVKVHAMEGRLDKMWDYGYGWGTSYRPGLGADIVYNEKTTATGEIYLFQKDMSYTSGIRRIT